MYGDTREETITPWKRFAVEAVTKFANNNDIKVTLLSGDWILLLQKNGKNRYVFGLDFGLNSSAAKLIARDKNATSDILSHHNIPCVPHRLFLRPASQGANPNGNWLSLISWFTECNNDVVCKPNNGSGGNGVSRVKTQSELEVIIQKLFAEERAIAVAPFINIEKEYRVTVLDNEVELVYEKERINPADFKFNLSEGSHAKDVTNNKTRASLEKLALDAAKATNTTFANFDIVESENGLQILEINSGVMFEHYAQQGEKERGIAESIYGKALKKLFAEQG